MDVQNWAKKKDEAMEERREQTWGCQLREPPRLILFGRGTPQVCQWVCRLRSLFTNQTTKEADLFFVFRDMKIPK